MGEECGLFDDAPFGVVVKAMAGDPVGIEVFFDPVNQRQIAVS